LRVGEQIIGRENARQADVLIAHPQVSVRHARLILNPNGCVGVEDLGSSNGSFIDQQKLLAGKIYALPQGKRITFASVSYQLRHGA